MKDAHDLDAGFVRPVEHEVVLEAAYAEASQTLEFWPAELQPPPHSGSLSPQLEHRLRGIEEAHGYMQAAVIRQPCRASLEI